MKKTCVICGTKKGKRICKLHQNAAICPVCCASIRNQTCEGCRYYTVAQRYQASKEAEVSSNVGSKHFVAEFNEEVDNAVEQALELCEKGKFRKASPILQELLAEHPRNQSVCYGMGIYHALQGHDDEALKYFDQATEIFPYFTDAYFNKGVIYKNRGDIKGTIQAFQTVVEVGDPRDEYVQQAHDLLQDLDQHLREHENVTLKTYVKAMEKFEQAFEAMEAQNWEQAIRYFQKSIKLNPRHPQSYGNMGICYGKLGQKDQALRAFDAALEIDPSYEPAIFNRPVVESLQDGEKLPPDQIKTIEYYKYASKSPRTKQSYLQTFVQYVKKLLPL